MYDIAYTWLILLYILLFMCWLSGESLFRSLVLIHLKRIQYCRLSVPIFLIRAFRLVFVLGLFFETTYCATL